MDLVSNMPKKNRRNDRNRARRAKVWGVLWKLLVCVGVLSFLAIDGYRAVPRLQYWWHNREIKQEYITEVERLRGKQRRLKEEMNKLEHSPLTQERLAREMGYIKPGETVYKLVPKSYDGAAPELTD